MIYTVDTRDVFTVHKAGCFHLCRAEAEGATFDIEPPTDDWDGVLAALDAAGSFIEEGGAVDVGPCVPQLRRRCPDGGACHHQCTAGPCWRVAACGPLSGVFPGDRWPEDIKREHEAI